MLTAPIFDEPDPFFHNDSIRQVFAEANARMEQMIGVHPDYAQAQDIVARHLAEAFEGQGPVPEALANAAAEIRTKLRVE